MQYTHAGEASFPASGNAPEPAMRNSRMTYSAKNLREAANAGVISVADLDRLLAFLASQEGQGAAGEASPAARLDRKSVV